MAKATKAKKPGKSVGIVIPKLVLPTLTFKIKGLPGVPLVVHNMSEKAYREMLQRQMATTGTTKVKEPKDPQAEYEAAFYRFTDSDKFGFPASAFKKVITRASKLLKDTKQINLDMIAVRQTIFIEADGLEDREIIVPLGDGKFFTHRVITPLIEIFGNPTMKMDVVRIGQGQTDIRFRPQFFDWTAIIRIKYNPELLSKEVVANLLYRGGMTVGIGEGRPEKSELSWGLFSIEGD